MDFGGKGEVEQGESSSAEEDPEVFAARVSWLQCLFNAYIHIYICNLYVIYIHIYLYM
jgi:hypothetical protein